MDPNTNTPIIVLKGINNETILPIWVGAYEANAIALEIEKIAAPRPLSHDLLKNFILQTDLKLLKVVISDLRNNTFFALLELTSASGGVIVLDARPSDAIALALRMDCAIFVEQKVFDVSKTSSLQKELDVKDKNIASTEDWPDLIS